MKKLTRSYRKKLVERAKTLLIVVLCVCCVYNIVKVIELYSGKDDVGGVFWGSNEPPASKGAEAVNIEKSYWTMAAPKTVLVAHSKGKYLFSPDDDEYDGLVRLVESAVKDMYSKKNAGIVGCDAAEWEKALAGNFMYTEFTYAHNSSFETQILLPEGSVEGEPREYSRMLLIPEGQNGGLKILLRSGGSGEVFAASCKVACDDLLNLFSSLARGEKSNSVFAYELNLHTEDANRLSLDSMLLMPVGERKVCNIVAHIPETYSNGINFTRTNEFTVNLISAFGYNPNTVRQYADSGGKIILVCETGTISVSPDGCIEYKALGENDGVSMLSSGQKQMDAEALVEGISNLNQSVLSVSGVGNEKNSGVLRISENTGQVNLSDIKLVMDYYVDNCRVSLGSAPAVEAVIKNGVLVEYRIKVKTIEKLDSSTACGDVLKAIDLFCEKNADSKKITDGNLVYYVTEDNQETPAVWEIKGE